MPAGTLPSGPPPAKAGAPVTAAAAAPAKSDVPVAAGPRRRPHGPCGPEAGRIGRGGRPGRAEPPRPVSLSARSVYVWVLRSDQTNQLKELQADGYVEVHQGPAKADEKEWTSRASTST